MERKLKATQLREAGSTFKEISEELGISTERARQMVRQGPMVKKWANRRAIGQKAIRDNPENCTVGDIAYSLNIRALKLRSLLELGEEKKVGIKGFLELLRSGPKVRDVGPKTIEGIEREVKGWLDQA